MSKFRIIVAAFLAMMLVFGLTACGEDDVAARVNGEVIKKSELDAQMAKLEEQYPQMFEGADAEGRKLDFQQRLLDNMINSVLIRQAAEEMGIEVTDADVQEQIDQLKSGFQTEEQFQQALEQAGMDLDSLEDQIRDQLITQELLEQLTADVEIPDEEIEQYYEANKDQFIEDAAVHVAHILFNPEDKATAEEVLAEIRAGGDFAALAKEYSQDPTSAESGGDLGWPTTPYVPEFQAAAEELEPGEVSDLVETTFGWHIIKMIEKRDQRQKTLDEVREQIEQILLQQHNADIYQKFIDDLRAEAEIEILIPELQVPVSGETTGTTGETEQP